MAHSCNRKRYLRHPLLCNLLCSNQLMYTQLILCMYQRHLPYLLLQLAILTRQSELSQTHIQTFLSFASVNAEDTSHTSCVWISQLRWSYSHLLLPHEAPTSLSLLLSLRLPWVTSLLDCTRPGDALHCIFKRVAYVFLL